VFIDYGLLSGIIQFCSLDLGDLRRNFIRIYMLRPRGEEKRMPLAQTILAHSAGLKAVKEGDTIQAEVDLIFFHEALGRALEALDELATVGGRIKDLEKVVVLFDHWVPAPKEESAKNHKRIREFVKRVGIKHFYDVGRGGIGHQLIAEEGFVLPGSVVVGSDSHTTTLGALGAFAMGLGPTDLVGALVEGRVWLQVPPSIGIEVEGRLKRMVSAKDLALKFLEMLNIDGADGKALEVFGSGIRAIGMAGRFTISNMAAETGAVTCIIPADEVTGRYLKGRARGRYFISNSDPSPGFEWSAHLNIDELEPLLAVPPDPGHIKPVRELDGTPVDQVYIGSCTNGRLEDIEVVAKMLKGRKVSSGTRLIVSPASQRTYLDAMRTGALEALIRAGAVIIAPSCNACLGGHQGLLAGGEVCLSTTNRNFPGRMGAKDATIYLASPETAAATALKGKITDPRDIK
jgi:homoaconitate hydratase family protein